MTEITSSWRQLKQARSALLLVAGADNLNLDTLESCFEYFIKNDLFAGYLNDAEDLKEIATNIQSDLNRGIDYRHELLVNISSEIRTREKLLSNHDD